MPVAQHAAPPYAALTDLACFFRRPASYASPSKSALSSSRARKTLPASKPRCPAAPCSHAAHFAQAAKGVPEVRRRLQRAGLDARLTLHVEEAYPRLVQEDPRAEAWRLHITVHSVAHDRMADVLQVGADLMRPQRADAALHERVAFFTVVWRLILRDRLPHRRGGLATCVHGHALQRRICRGVNGGNDLPALGRQGATDQGDVVLQQPGHDLLSCVLVACQGLAHEDRTRGVQVQAVCQATVAALVT
mmetsp:Transcript_113444/g.301460  ORF Transcript_113444/g.301460 Transcript_113444/m.301460 type:complete len:248 (+) Transcript_113444:60-803(+)